MFQELFICLCDIVSSLFLKEQYTTLKDKYAKLYVSSVSKFRVKRPHFINAHRKMMVVYLACLVCRRAPSRGEATWPLCMNTCRAAVKSWCICQGSRRGSCRETGATSCLTLPASAWSMKWAASDDGSFWLYLKLVNMLKIKICFKTYTKFLIISHHQQVI